MASEGRGVTLPLGHDPLEIQPASGLEQLAPFCLEAWHPVQRANRGRDEPFKVFLPSGEGQLAEIPPIEPEQVKGGVGKPTLASHEVPEVDAPRVIYRHDLPIHNHLTPRELRPNLLRQLAEASHEVSPLRVERAALTGEVQDTAEPIVLGLKQP